MLISSSALKLPNPIVKIIPDLCFISAAVFMASLLTELVPDIKTKEEKEILGFVGNFLIRY